MIASSGLLALAAPRLEAARERDAVVFLAGARLAGALRAVVFFAVERLALVGFLALDRLRPVVFLALVDRDDELRDDVDLPER